MKIRTIMIIVTVLIHCVPLASKAQETWIDTSIHKGLVEINADYPFKILLSDDSLKPPYKTLKKLNGAKQYFDEVFDMDLDFSVLFIENKNWNEYAYFPPPGMPQAWKGNIILGIDKSILAAKVENLLLQLPEQDLTSLKEVYGDTLNLDLFYRESLSIHELAHLYHHFDGGKPQRKWLQELFATMSMYSFVKNKCNSSFKLMNAYPKFVIQRGNKFAEYKTLKDFEEKYAQKLDPQNYEWFQMQFYEQAKRIIDSNNDKILVQFRNFLIQTDLNKMELFSDTELASRLQKEVSKDVADILINWEYK